MKLKARKGSSEKVKSRQKKKLRIRKVISGTAMRPRLCVFRSLNHIYAQLIDDSKGLTILQCSSLSKDFGSRRGKELAKEVGGALAKLAQEKDIKEVVFDRNGYLYHGRVRAVAEGAREAGLNF